MVHNHSMQSWIRPGIFDNLLPLHRQIFTPIPFKIARRDLLVYEGSDLLDVIKFASSPAFGWNTLELILSYRDISRIVVDVGCAVYVSVHARAVAGMHSIVAVNRCIVVALTVHVAVTIIAFVNYRIIPVAVFGFVVVIIGLLAFILTTFQALFPRFILTMRGNRQTFQVWIQ